MAPTVHEDIYKQAVRDLADFTEPTLSGFSDYDIDSAMAWAVTAEGARPGWLERLRAAIEEVSDGHVTMEDADPEEFPAAVKGLGFVYQRLRDESEERTQLLIIGHSERPFRFVRGTRDPSSSLHAAVRESLRDIIDGATRGSRR
ncbi:hypothetical protein [Streptomyces canus]|uniref:hypothetical protein n=1 Tax=Streptomyces canus TaxID=58343 RepID=UPI002E259C0E